jgi:hypothetical protein
VGGVEKQRRGGAGAELGLAVRSELKLDGRRREREIAAQKKAQEAATDQVAVAIPDVPEFAAGGLLGRREQESELPDLVREVVGGSSP